MNTINIPIEQIYEMMDDQDRLEIISELIYDGYLLETSEKYKNPTIIDKEWGEVCSVIFNKRLFMGNSDEEVIRNIYDKYK